MIFKDCKKRAFQIAEHVFRSIHYNSNISANFIGKNRSQNILKAK